VHHQNGCLQNKGRLPGYWRLFFDDFGGFLLCVSAGVLQPRFMGGYFLLNLLSLGVGVEVICSAQRLLVRVLTS
jgi:hypothetical protein